MIALTGAQLQREGVEVNMKWVVHSDINRVNPVTWWEEQASAILTYLSVSAHNS